VFNLIVKTTKSPAPTLRRALIVDPDPGEARALGERLRSLFHSEIWVAPSLAKALGLAAKIDPQVIFCAYASEKLDGVAFTRTLRHGSLACRQAPVILTGEASAAGMLAGRDAGAHEFLRRPFGAKDLQRRLEAVLLHPRGWVEAVDYVGPDRRRFNSADYPGPLKRLSDIPAPPQEVRIGEALKIVRSALGAMDREPQQALRALLAQTAELQAIAAETPDDKLAQAAAEFRRHLTAAASDSAWLDSAEAHRRGAALLAYAGRDARAAA